MTDMTVRKGDRIQEVRNLLGSFGKAHLTHEITTYCFNLLDMLGRKRSIDITRGKREIWASAIVCVIARLNYLFYKESIKHISMNMIYDYFNTKAGAVGVRAVEIEKVCKITIGHEGLCRKDIMEGLKFVRFPNGKVISNVMGKKRIWLKRYL
jgi:hypothetical protein